MLSFGRCRHASHVNKLSRWFTTNKQFPTSNRVNSTNSPVIVSMQQILQGQDDVLSLAQGIVHWKPPAQALDLAEKEIREPATSLYGRDEGNIELCDALLEKVRIENGFQIHDKIMVTAGANQAYTNVVLSLMDGIDDQAIIFTPFYFNHVMSHQMTGSYSNIIYGESNPDSLTPNIAWLKNQLTLNKHVKMVTIVNPSNPCGTIIPPSDLLQIAKLCEEFDTWLVVDNTYEYFVFDDHKHQSVEGKNVVNIFSFSKAYGMMGWRIGYLSYYGDHLHDQLLKIQDTLVICPTKLSQKVALGALQAGRGWVDKRVQRLDTNRQLLRSSLSSVLGEESVKGGVGGIYLFAELPGEKVNDQEIVKQLVNQYGVCVIPGNACGSDGWIRVCFGNLKPDLCEEAAIRLKKGLTALL